jgi:hypothetical protein
MKKVDIEIEIRLSPRNRVPGFFDAGASAPSRRRPCLFMYSLGKTKYRTTSCELYSSPNFLPPPQTL